MISNSGGPFGIKQFWAIIDPFRSDVPAVGSAGERVIPVPDQYKFTPFLLSYCNLWVIECAAGVGWLNFVRVTLKTRSPFAFSIPSFFNASVLLKSHERMLSSSD